MNSDQHFPQLLAVAAAEPEPQRLLFVFAAAELPDNATPDQRARFQSGRGGALGPLMCVDKAPRDLPDFAALAAEAARRSSSSDGATARPPAPPAARPNLRK